MSNIADQHPVDAEMCKILELITKADSDNATLCRNTQRFVFGPFSIYVCPRSKFKNAVVAFCNRHQAFLNGKPDLQQIDRVLLDGCFEGHHFAALGLAYGLFTVSETESNAAIPRFTVDGYTVRSEE